MPCRRKPSLHCRLRPFGKRALNRPAAPDSGINSKPRHAKFTAPFRNTQGFAGMNNKLLFVATMPGRGERLFHAPPGIKPALGGGVSQAKFLAPLTQRLSFATECKHSVSASIARLLFSCSPSHIPRLVVAVVVWVAINLHSWRALAYVTQECLERINPLSEHCNSAASIICKSLMAFIEAPAFNPLPYEVRRSVAQPMLVIALE